MLFSVEGSRANAEVLDYLPQFVTTQAETALVANSVPADAALERTTVFVSAPVVQAIPAPVEPINRKPDFDMVEATSLGDLVTAMPEPSSLGEELHCLAGAIYFESKGESLAGQLAVGRVIIARAQSGRFPESYCGVVLQRSQFSFVRGGRIPSINQSSKAWSRAKKLAMIANAGSWQSEAEGALFFHAKYAAPGWRNRMARLAQIDNHIFYR
ncbi:cell wall hydrolase [Croceicoccus sp. F390]|uniref:Cell wall hydrolase n=1 Tax=Croceicoccus esteveae TaxID=3075597 RepID=A0ABU2ZLB1_9SPHN|nr:cell wall hydrolase [Croceicoccus sp. F390]MDT0576212.1 cell wall hydrolase [Croceicoccus sp. F390]